MTILAIIFILLMFIVILFAMSVVQMRMAGINIKDFISFIKANDSLDKLSAFAKRYDNMSPQEQIIYIAEAEKMFNAFDKIPESVWEDEYDKYKEVLDKYKDIKVMRWNEAQDYAISKKVKKITIKIIMNLINHTK